MQEDGSQNFELWYNSDKKNCFYEKSCRTVRLLKVVAHSLLNCLLINFALNKFQRNIYTYTYLPRNIERLCLRSISSLNFFLNLVNG